MEKLTENVIHKYHAELIEGEECIKITCPELSIFVMVEVNPHNEASRKRAWDEFDSALNKRYIFLSHNEGFLSPIEKEELEKIRGCDHRS